MPRPFNAGGIKWVNRNESQTFPVTTHTKGICQVAMKFSEAWLRKVRKTELATKKWAITLAKMGQPE